MVRRNPDVFALAIIVLFLAAGFGFSRLPEPRIRSLERKVKEHEVHIERVSEKIAERTAAHAEQINKQLERKFGKPGRVLE